MTSPPENEARKPAEPWQIVDAVTRAKDILANRREHDCCGRNECMYPNLPEMAEEILALAAVIEQQVLREGAA